MIITATPLRISFVGGGTDFEDFYRKYPGRVLTTTIDKYIYITSNQKFDGRLKMSYSKTEDVKHRDQLEHSIAKATLEEVGIETGIEIATISDIPGKGTGLGSSSSLTVGLLKNLYAFLGKHTPADALAEKACRIEINKTKAPIGKQDQYIAAFGGLNTIVFNLNGKIDVEPIFLSPKTKDGFQKHLLSFFTGIQRSSGPILSEQRENINKKFEFLKNLSDLVPIFKENLEQGNFRKLGRLLDQNWQMKKELSSGISNPEIEQMYNIAIEAGAWGGKIAGAGGGGFLLLIAPPEKHEKIKNALNQYQLMPFRFSEAGSRIIFRN